MNLKNISFILLLIINCAVHADNYQIEIRNPWDEISKIKVTVRGLNGTVLAKKRLRVPQNQEHRVLQCSLSNLPKSVFILLKFLNKNKEVATSRACVFPDDQSTQRISDNCLSLFFPTTGTTIIRIPHSG